MDQSAHSDSFEHVINVARGNTVSTSTRHHGLQSEQDNLHCQDRPSTSTQNPTSGSSQSSPSSSSSSPDVYDSRSTPVIRSSGSYNRNGSPLNSGLWISTELVVYTGQIISAIVVLSLSRDEHPHAPLFAWIVGYTAGCIATLPQLYWRYIHRNSQASEQEPEQARHVSFQFDNPETTTNNTTTSSQSFEGDRHSSLVQEFWHNFIACCPRLDTLVYHFKMALDCFFAVWFVVGNVWIFGGHSSSSEAPNLYRLCLAFLIFSCIGYAIPFTICATVCCCFPCIISILRSREDLGQHRGATTEVISGLPTYHFKSKISKNKGTKTVSENLADGGILGPGTKEERAISSEDAVCCICLGKYLDNDNLRELPCAHFFHVQCVDKWLKINAICPLCKAPIGNTTGSLLGAYFALLRGDRRLGGGVAATRVAV